MKTSAPLPTYQAALEKAFGRHELLPIQRQALFGPFPRPRPEHLFGGGLARTLDEIHAPAQGLLSAQSLPLCSPL
jgi:hypothetical protein